MIAALAGGLLAGAGHALAGPDHVAAVLPLASADERSGTRAGLIWGAGHSAGVLLLGALAWLLGPALPLESAGASMEFVVGFALVATGAWALRRGRRAHQHTNAAPTGRAAAGIGLLHGAAGGTHLVVVLGAMALSRIAALAWLGAFLVGATLAMGAVGWGVQRAGTRWAETGQRRLQIVCGVAAIVVGIAWMANVLLG